jgi:hypothetical protein
MLYVRQLPFCVPTRTPYNKEQTQHQSLDEIGVNYKPILLHEALIHIRTPDKRKQHLQG